MSVSEMRKMRMRSFIIENEKAISEGKIANIYNYNPSKADLDNGKFVSKYFDLVNNKQYQTLFCQYNEAMFAKVS